MVAFTPVRVGATCFAMTTVPARLGEPDEPGRRKCAWLPGEWKGRLQRGRGQQAPIKTMSRIDNPGAFGRVNPGSPITGVAWAQTTRSSGLPKR